MSVRSPEPKAWIEKSAKALPLRPAGEVMRLERLGSFHQTRISFVRSLMRRMSRERWRISQPVFEIDDEGFGTAVYRVATPCGVYSFVCFSDRIADEERTDRVIAERWDHTYALIEAEADAAEIARLRFNVPKQELGRYCRRDLVISRANKSMRLFQHVLDRLGQGRQPDVQKLADVGYLVRTTAVYGNGKFGMADYGSLRNGSAFPQPFSAQMLAVYLARQFSLDAVEHVARRRNPDGAVRLDPSLRRYLGVGNATGLGMAPFLISHPQLIHQWVWARETALARVCAQPRSTPEARNRFLQLLSRTRRHVAEWHTQDERQSARIAVLEEELGALARRGFPRCPQPWRALVDSVARKSLETQELLHSLILEPHGWLVDDLEDQMAAEDRMDVEPAMRLDALKSLLEKHYAWVLDVDFSDPATMHYFWYRSEAKEEPRLGRRGVDPGDDLEMPIGVGREAARLWQVLNDMPPDRLACTSVARLLIARPDLRAIVRRVQSLVAYPYAEIRDNLLGADCVPVDILRCKLSFFGAVKFDPKSDRWTRITLFQGAPLPEEIEQGADADDWFAPVCPPQP